MTTATIRPHTVALHERSAPPGARMAQPDPGPRETVALSPAVEAPEVARGLGVYSRLALAGLGALALFGGGVATAHASPPQSSIVQDAGVVRLQQNPDTVQRVRTYIADMVDNNRIAGETLNTYQKSFENNWNTLVRIERRIVENPTSLNDPTIRRIYEKTEAALDSIQVFTDVHETRIYSTGSRMTVETWDGTRMSIPQTPVQRTYRTTRDYSGAARMTDATVSDIDQMVHPGTPRR